jgi:hypothetical protein
LEQTVHAIAADEDGAAGWVVAAVVAKVLGEAASATVGRVAWLAARVRS